MMSSGTLAWLFDAILLVLIVLLAWRSLNSDDLFKSVVLFIAFGLLVALAWTRLYAPDAALAEAAIGSGLAGAFLLATLARLPNEGAEAAFKVSDGRHFLLLGLGVGLLLGLLLTLAEVSVQAPGLVEQAYEALPVSGVDHGVTAVLLNYRLWDTALELAVLLWAWVAQRSLAAEAPLSLYPLQGEALPAAMKIIGPILFVVALYLLWRGAFAPGGAFQSGAVLAAGLVLLYLARNKPWPSGWWVRLGWVAGFWSFITVGVWGAWQGVSFLGYQPEQAGALILLIEIAATLSIALSLAWLFSGEVSTRKSRQAQTEGESS